MSSAVLGQATPRAALGAGPQWARRVDAPLLAAAATLLLFGLVMVASASIGIAAKGAGAPLALFWRQAAFVVVAVLIAAAAACVPLELLRRLSGLALIASLLGLALVLVPGVGKEVNGSIRWLSFGPVNLQPSEFAKVALVVYLAGYLVRRAEEVRSSLSGFFKPVAVLVLIAVLLLLEPDFGATAVIFATALGMLFLGGVPLTTFLGWMALIGCALGAVLLTAPYRLARLLAFTDPWADPFDTGFQLTQALIAIGRGEWFGVGLGASVQKLFYLPEAHTDFLFAVLGEELGLAGMLVVLALFVTIVWRGFAIARLAARRGDAYGSHLAHGLALLLGMQAVVNIGVNLGVLPTKGLTLPLMSYGGSSLVASSLCVALLLRVGYEARGAK